VRSAQPVQSEAYISPHQEGSGKPGHRGSAFILSFATSRFFFSLSLVIVALPHRLHLLAMRLCFWFSAWPLAPPRLAIDSDLRAKSGHRAFFR
jgi:hypothetical protein